MGAILLRNVGVAAWCETKTNTGPGVKPGHPEVNFK